MTHPIKNRQGRSALTAAWTFLAWNAAVTEQLRFSYAVSWRSVLLLLSQNDTLPALKWLFQIQ